MIMWITGIGFLLLSMLVQYRLRSKFREYSSVPVRNGLTGKDVAEKMLAENGVRDVRVICVEGELTDHYNPQNKTVNLSPDVYHRSSVAAAAVAAHECGHAIQHASAYSFLQMRSALVPVVSVAANWTQWILLAGMLLLFFAKISWVLLIGIVFFAATTLFSIITLPVEVDASRRALLWLRVTHVTHPETHDKAEDALRWAAYTYFIAAIASLVTLIQYILMYLSNRE